MAALTVLALVAVGVAVGLISGLVGIGGGVLIVPFLYFFYDHPELFGAAVAEPLRTVIAHGTSLFIIVPTSIGGALAYHRARLVEWRAVVPIGLASTVGAVAGAHLALRLPEEALKIGFGAMLVFSGARLGLNRPPRGVPAAAALEPRVSIPATVPIGLAVGLFSALLGVGGGIIAIPLLMYLVRLEVRKLAATSMGIIIVTATAGAASYMWTGRGQPGLPPWSAGYVHLSAGLTMATASAVTVRWGAALNQRLHPRTLALMFALLFVLLGVRLVLENGWDLIANRSSPPAAATAG